MKISKLMFVTYWLFAAMSACAVGPTDDSIFEKDAAEAPDPALSDVSQELALGPLTQGVTAYLRCGEPLAWRTSGAKR